MPYQSFRYPSGDSAELLKRMSRKKSAFGGQVNAVCQEALGVFVPHAKTVMFVVFWSRLTSLIKGELSVCFSLLPQMVFKMDELSKTKWQKISQIFLSLSTASNCRVQRQNNVPPAPSVKRFCILFHCICMLSEYDTFTLCLTFSSFWGLNCFSIYSPLNSHSKSTQLFHGIPLNISGSQAMLKVLIVLH